MQHASGRIHGPEPHSIVLKWGRPLANNFICIRFPSLYHDKQNALSKKCQVILSGT